MTKAPERIWTGNTEGKCHIGFDTPSMNFVNEYVRADILANTLAANAALVKRLEEARVVLQTINDAHVPDQPAALALSELLYVHRHVAYLRGIARAFLAGGE